MMKLLIVLVAALVFVSANSEQHKEKEMKDRLEKCGESAGVDKEHMLKVRNGEVVPVAKDYQFVDCVYKDAKIMNDAGVIQKDIVVTKLTDAGVTDASTIVDTCIVECGTDVTKMALNLGRCIQKHCNQILSKI